MWHDHQGSLGAATARLILVVLAASAARDAGAQPAPAEPLRVSLWAAGAPGSEARKGEPEQAKDWWVKNVHDPSITVFLPAKDKATGTGVVVAPGGGHRELVFNPEGRDAAQYLTSIGVAAFVVKYRLAREDGSPYSVDVHARADAYRAMRLVRSRAAEWGVDPARVGFMGFSAGGEVASMVAFGDTAGSATAADPIDRLSARPDFVVFIYPGPAFIPATVAAPPPAFVLAANDDPCCSGPSLLLVERYRAAKAPIELHLLAKGAHGFNMGNRSKLASVKGWPLRLGDWLADNGWLTAAAGVAAR
jgi:acetyl esterase/lipase